MQQLEFFNLETKMPYLGILGSNFEKPLSYLEPTPSNLPYCKFDPKKKFLNLGPKMPDLRILGLEFQNIIVIFEISILKFVLFQSLVQKEKILKFGTKNALFGYFWAGS